MLRLRRVLPKSARERSGLPFFCAMMHTYMAMLGCRCVGDDVSWYWRDQMFGSTGESLPLSDTYFSGLHEIRISAIWA